MANHVSFYISASTDDSVDFTEIFEQRKNTYKSSEDLEWEVTEVVELERQCFMRHLDRSFDEDGYLENSYDWYCTNVGAKWCNIEEVEQESVYGYSAWSPPIEMLGNMAKYLKTDLRMNYEDEFRNFVGVAWADEDGHTSYEETDGDDFVEQLCEKLGIDELPDDFDWWEEYKDSGIIPQEWIDDAVYTWFDEQ